MQPQNNIAAPYPHETTRFIQNMASRDFGIFAISGTTASGKTNLMQTYLKSFPKNVRMVTIADIALEYSHLETSASNMVISHDRSKNSGAELIREALKMRPSVIAYDSVIDSEVLALLVMASITCNTAVTLHERTITGTLNHVEGILHSPEWGVTTAGFWNNLKGVITATIDESHGGHIRYQHCLEITPPVREFFQGNPDWNLETSRISIEHFAESQGYLTVEKQIQNRFSANKLPLATSMTFDKLYASRKGLAISGGDLRARNLLVRGIAHRYSDGSKGERVAYLSNPELDGNLSDFKKNPNIDIYTMGKHDKPMGDMLEDDDSMLHFLRERTPYTLVVIDDMANKWVADLAVRFAQFVPTVTSTESESHYETISTFKEMITSDNSSKPSVVYQANIHATTGVQRSAPFMPSEKDLSEIYQMQLPSGVGLVDNMIRSQGF